MEECVYVCRERERDIEKVREIDLSELYYLKILDYFIVKY